MRTAKNKRLEITLTNDEMTLLESLSVRFNISKSSVIKQALKVFASKRKHYLTISYKDIEPKEETTEGLKVREKTDKKVTDKEWDKLFEDEPKKQNENEDEMPF